MSCAMKVIFRRSDGRVLGAQAVGEDRADQRAYTATRCLLQNGFDASVVSGGMLSHALLEGVTDEAPAGVNARRSDDLQRTGLEPDGATMYLVDSGPRVVHAFAFDPDR